ncbi:BTAD domain-containing putative transcriptional regulator [Actinoplanes sp. NPDC049118]|uniref:AfsR/SARP family transcriptional regulator n=1 Tax=Actinoplanes sp. NPDC049118 TaxID=3155769 RepID=UPI0033CED5CA
MELRLLGPPELVTAGGPIDLGGPRQRTVLSILALNAGRVTPVYHLLDGVWGDDPPPTARSQIQICISVLRKLIAGSQTMAIRTQPPGYVLTLAPDQLDIDRFHALVATGRAHAADGRTTEAAADLRAALALWRGPALAGIVSTAVERQSTQLQEQRAAVLEERLDLDLALGRHQECVGELRALVAEQPLREHLHALLMIALYRCGRQADALEAGRRARAILADQIGVDPGPELQETERAVLTRDPALDLPRVVGAPGQASARSGEERAAVRSARTVPRQLPPSIADFTGRSTQLADVRSAVTGAGDYAMPVVAISGPGGVGKSSLAVRAAHELAGEFPDGQLYADLRSSDVDEGVTRQLARFLRALGVPGTSVPDDRDERIEMYRTELADRRMLVVLDDATDEEQVLSLLPGSPTCAVIVTSRTRLSGLPGAHRIAVDILDTGQSLDLITELIGVQRAAAEPEACAELVQLCAGLPLALRIAGARLTSRPHWRVADLVRRLADVTHRLDEFAHKGLELRSNIALTYRGLTEPARRLFRLAALIHAPDFPGWAAAALLDSTLHQAEDLLESLVEAEVLTAATITGEHPPRFRFHDLIRVFGLEQAAEEESPAEQRAALARYLGGWLSLSDEAHRREYGGEYTVLHGTAERWLPPDGEQPEPIGDSLSWWERERRGLVPAIRQAAADGLDEACWDLSLTSVTLFEARGYYDDWAETATLAAGVTGQAGNARGLAAANYALGTYAMAQKRLDDALVSFTAALDTFTEIADVHGQALVQRNIAFISRLRGDTRDSATRYALALAGMRTAGDRMGEAHILSSLARLRIDDGDSRAARAMLDEALQICVEAKCVRVEAQVTFRLAELHLGCDDLDEARRALHHTLRAVRDLDDKVGEAYTLQALGSLRYREGRLEAAHTSLSHAIGLAQEIGDRWLEGQALFALGEVTLARHNGKAAVRHLREAADCFAGLNAALWQAKALVLLAEVEILEGDRSAAGGHLGHADALLTGLDSAEGKRLTEQAARLAAEIGPQAPSFSQGPA